MIDSLCIISNGFNLHDGIPSAYSTCGRYVAARDAETAETAELVERYFLRRQGLLVRVRGALSKLRHQHGGRGRRSVSDGLQHRRLERRLSPRLSV